jgi:hypothetical protein
VTYVPTANLTPLYTFTQFTTAGGVSAFNTALNTAYNTLFPGMTIQCFADTTSGHTSNAVVVVNDQQVFSVPPDNYVGFNQGTWAQYPAAQMAGGASSTFTVYP